MVLSPRSLEKIRHFITEFSGISPRSLSRKSLQEKISDHIQSLDLRSADDYLMLLKSSNGGPIREDLIAMITVNESFFFRNPEQFEFIGKVLIPELLARQPSSCKRIRCWSAACSGGEEPYSLAAVALWALQNANGVTLTVEASDINKAYLEAAKVGMYRPRSFRDRSWQFQRKMGISLAREFRGDYLVDEKIRRCVTFRNLNLRDVPSLNCMAGSDIIMCRNVLIYFDEPFRLDLINAFHRLLNPGGMLFLGETESLPHLPEKYELVKCYDAYGYRKVTAGNGQ